MAADVHVRVSARTDSQAENASSILVARSTYSGKKVQVERLLFTGCDSRHANCGCHLVPFANGVGG
jgi:hypothetical protein